MELTNSSISGNVAGIAGGGLYNSGTARVSNSALLGNTANLFGGGINNSSTGTLNFANSTLSGNTANSFPGSHGGGISNSGDLTVANSTLTGNATTSGGGDLYNGATANALLLNSIFAQSLETDRSIAGTGTVLGASNLINTPASAGGFTHGTDGNIIGQAGPSGTRVFLPVENILAPLADNGGLTKTHALVAGSPAIDAGQNSPSNGLTDQRGGNFPRQIGPSVDIGAFEALIDDPALYVVNTLSDEFDFSNTSVSLREALYAANFFVPSAPSPTNNVITFAPTLSGSITLTLGPVEITDSVQIVGPGASRLSIDADQQSRVIQVQTPSVITVQLEGLTISGGRTTASNANGAGILFNASAGSQLELINSVVSGNSTAGSSAQGGGIYAGMGEVLLRGTTISGNSTENANAFGGGIATAVANVSMINSTLSGNSTIGQNSHGGGIFSIGGNVSLVNSTLSNNQASGSGSNGGGVWVDDAIVTINSSTVVENSAKGLGGGIFVDVDTTDKKMTIYNSIIASNTASSNADFMAPNAPATNLDVKFSLIGDSTGTSLTNGNGNLLGTPGSPLDPGIAPLAFNGGPTQTHALLATSPALNKGDNSLASALNNDQRGAPFARIAGTTVDMGAYEQQALAASFFVVTTLNDELDYSNTDVSLREAINAANGNLGTDTITFASALTSSGPATIKLTQGELLITDSVNVTGAVDLSSTAPGAGLITIDADKKSRVLNVQGTTATTVDVSIQGLKLTNGLHTTDVGGGILFDSRGNLNLTDSTVSGSQTTGENGFGGGIYTNLGQITLLRSVVTGNSTTGKNSLGGGIHSYSGKLTLTDSLVSQNSTAGQYASGGGIVVGSAEVVLTNSIIDANFTKGDDAIGGGIASFDGKLTVQGGSIVRNNYTVGVRSAGGGIGKFTGDLSLTSSQVIGNFVQGEFSQGGGIFTASGAINLTLSDVSGNQTEGLNSPGGGISTDSGNVTLVQSTVSKNKTLKDGSFAGGINSFSGAVSLNESAVSGNSTSGVGSSGGGILTNTGAITLDRSQVTDNATYLAKSPGGGIHSSFRDITLTSSTVSGNRTMGLESQGGGIYSASGTVSLESSTLSNNRSDGDSSPGGGLRTASGDINLTNSTVSGNSTKGSNSVGGGVSTYRGDVKLVSSTIANNFTSGTNSSGGGVFVNFDASILITDPERGSLTIQNSIIAQNSVASGVTGPDLFAANFAPVNPTAVIGVQSSLIGNNADTQLIAAPVGSPDGNGNLIGTRTAKIDPLLGSLGINGGVSATHALKAGSPAIDAGNDTLSPTLTDDQRGVPFVRKNGPIDMGSYERQTLTLPSPLVVTTLDDESDLNPLSNLNDVSLREAIGLANGNVGTSDTITFAPTLVGSIHLSPWLGQLQITDSVTITGNGALDTIIDAKQQGFRVIDVIGDATDVTISGVTITGGKTTGNGGGINFLSSGHLTLSNSTLSGNQASLSGGGIYNIGRATITNSTLSGNQASSGGGIVNGGSATITNSTLSGNQASSLGGGIGNSGTATISNSTLSGNQAVDGGGIFNLDTAILKNTIVVGSVSGGDIRVEPGNNVTGSNNLIGTLTSAGGLTNGLNGNIVGFGGLTLTADQVLAPLAFNGGPTPTHALVFGSPAINRGDSSLASGLTTDQRGVGFNRIIGNQIDIGAYETAALTSQTVVSSLNPSTSGEAVTFTATVSTDPGFGVPTGSMSFSVDGGALTNVPLDNNGTASFTTSTLSAGMRIITAIYAGSGDFKSSTASVSQTVIPTLAINDVTVTEGNSGTANANFAVTLSGAIDKIVTVRYATADGTATQPSDYTSASGTLTFFPGETSKTITVPVIGDSLDEVNETFTVVLSAPTNASIADTTGIGTITDDDASPTLSMNDVTVTEGNTGTVNATFTVTLSAASGQEVKVNYATANGTATQPADYNSTSNTLTFAPGETTKTFTVAVQGDSLDEANESFNVNLSTPVNATIADGTGVGTITDDDASPTLSINDVTVTEGNAGTVNATFTVTLSAASGQEVKVNYETVNGTALQPADYTPIAGTLTFAPGETTKTVTVAVKGDTLDEINETFNVNLATPVNATIADGVGVGTITDDDALPTLSINDVTVTEGNAGTVNATFTVTLSAASGQEVKVNYETANGAALQPADYTPSTGTLTFAPGETTKTITVAVKGDTLDEINEAFNVNLATPVNATIADGVGVGTISDDDAATTLSINDVTVTEGNTGTVNATFTVTLSAASGQEVKVNYETANGTALQPSDYTPITGTLTFAPGETTKTITVAVKGDTVDEANEAFNVNLATPVNATIADGTGVGTITDDDAATTLSINDVIVTEGNTGTVNATFTVTLSATSGQEVKVNYETANGTALQPADYTPITGTLTFAPGETTKTITVAVKGDTVDEANEAFNVNLATPVNATIADGVGVGTISDDDAATTLSINDVTVTEGNAGTVNATFTVTLSAASGQEVKVNYETANGTALQPSDYTPITGTLTFAPGETTKTITVAVKGDTLDEANEAFNVNLATPINATIADGIGVGTITDDDAATTLSINDVTVTEGNTGTVNATFTVTLSAASGQEVKVNYETANDTALQPADYTPSTGTLTFAPGETTKAITVIVKGDTLDEANETFNINLATPVNATIADGVGVGTITDDDALPTLSINDVTVTEGNAGTVNATFTVTLSAASGQEVKVNYETANGTALQPADYTPITGTLTFAPGETTKTITVAVKGDTLDEANETFNINLATPLNATIADGVGVGTITDDDASPTLSINDVTVTEGNAGTVNATFTVTLSAASGQEVKVNYETANGTALQPADYTPSTGTLTFAPGETTKTITVAVKGDTVDEANEAFNVNLATPVNATIADGVGIGTITDDDASPTLSINDVTVTEGNAGTVNATFTVTLSAASGQEVKVNYETANGTALQPADYTPITGTLTFAPGETTKTITVAVKGDTLDEANETFNVNLATPVNATIADGVGIGTITDDDEMPTVSLSVNQATVAEAAGIAIVTATLSAPSGLPVTIELGFTGTAAITNDFTSSATRIVIPAGQTTGTVTLTSVQDAVDESGETIIVDITGAANANEATTQQATVAITDDDSAPSVTLTVNNANILENAGIATFTATLSEISGLPVTVGLEFTGTATLTSDYTRSAVQSIVIPAGQKTGTFTITAVSDSIDEPNETVIVDIASVTNGVEVSPQQARTTITDDDPTVSVSLSRSSASIPEAAGTTSIIATLSAPSGLPVTVDLGFSGTASLNTDYTRSSTRITIAPGSTSGSITLTAVQDAIDEANESIVADILTVTGGLPGATTQATVLINDDDATPQVTLARDKAFIVEAGGAATFTATLSAVSGQPVTIALGFTGTGVLDSNYSRSGSQIVIPPGQISGSITVTALQDTNSVGESITVAITGVTNGVESGTQTQTTSIIDDEAPPRVSLAIDKSLLSEAAETATVTATLSHAYTLPVTVNLDFGGLATFGVDYQASSRQITIPAGSTTGSITLTTIQDDIDGTSTDEDLIVGIASVTNGIEDGLQSATSTIIDDGNLIDLTVDRSTIFEGGTAATFKARMSRVSRLP